jgi:integrase
MARPRKDGRAPAGAIRIGTARTSASGRTWRVRSYGPTPTAPRGRVVYINPATARLTSNAPPAGASLDDMFDQVERHLDQNVAMGTPVGEGGRVDPGRRRDLNALSQMYLDYLRLRARDQGYIANRRSQITKWILPAIGSVLVADWTSAHSQAVIRAARDGGLSPARVEDIGVTLSGMRKTAWRRRDGGRWLSREEDPLEEVEYGRGATVQGAGRNYTPPQRRPETESVEAAIAAAGRLGRWPWMGSIISVAGYCALRLGEQLALRAVDVDLVDRLLEVNGTWAVPPSGRRAGQAGIRVGYRKPHPKNRMRRTAPYRGSQHDMLVRLCALALGLPEAATTGDVADAIEVERARRAAMTRSGDWREVRVPAADEPWLFPGEGGRPPTGEQFNHAWHVVRDGCGWPRAIPYKNLRHHGALWWRAQGFAWETIAAWDGHDVQTLMAYYLVPSAEATKRARTTLDLL